MEFLIVEVYDSYRLWCLSAAMIRKIRRYDSVEVLESRAIVEELERVLCVFERPNISSLPDGWLRWGEVRSLEP